MVMKVSLHNRQVNAYHGAMAEKSEAGMERTILTLTGPRAIRAIAHEARQQVIDELYSGSVLTATEAARICGLSPSAMSYHLRALEKWGIVVRDQDSSDGRDGRERPWRAGADDLRLGRGDPAPGTSMRQAANAVISTLMAGLNKAVDTWLESDPKAGGASLSHGRLYLTDDEAAALNSDLDALVRRYEAGRTSRNKPVDATPRDQYWLLFPHLSRRGR
jgi:DNA-binding transcriptional ArsR family regulator